MDLYKPTPVGTLFELIYQKEYFDPDYSKRKAYQVITRFHQWSEKLDPKFCVLSTPLGYQLSEESPLVLQFIKDQTVGNFSDKTEIYLQKIKSNFPNTTFTAEDLEKLLFLSRRSVNRVLKQLEGTKNLVTVGKGRSTKYRLK
jgi:hypothetical protein